LIRVPWPGGSAALGGGVRSSRSSLTSGGLSTLASGGFRGVEGLTAEILIGQDPSWLLPTVTRRRQKLYESMAAIVQHRRNSRAVVNSGLEFP